MPIRMRLLFLLLLSFTSLAIAGNKEKLPTYVLRARTVVVLIDPNAGISTTSPLANKTAQDDVEKAIMKWGRLNPIIDTQTADLVIAIRKGSGKLVDQTVGGIPTNDRPVIVQPTDTGIRIGGQQGGAPGSSTQPQPQDTRPGPQTELGFSEDTFVVYQGPIDGPLEQKAIAWRYSAKDALHSPDVPAVGEFRKILEKAEKQQKAKP